MPWRETKEPYPIWVSEIILQQTRVEQGYNYFLRFIEAFPDIPSLAEAKEERLLKVWQGLGYYNRAHNMQHAARTIVKKYHARFPSSYEEILSLKGIGDYTAAAIASFAFDLPYAVVDGNVIRLLSRLFGIWELAGLATGKRTFQEFANRLLPVDHSAAFNAAVMDMGAMICTPANPHCDICPIATNCWAKQHNKQADLPIRSKKTVVQKRYYNYLVVKQGKAFFLQQRDAQSIWKKLYEFPFLESNTKITTPNKLKKYFPQEATQWQEVEFLQQTEHKLSHRHIFASFFKICLLPHSPIPETWKLVAPSQLNRFPVHRLIDKFLSK